MIQVGFLPVLQRMRVAALIGLTGGAVGQVMILWPGHMGRFLPPFVEMTLAAAFGAALAGVMLADMFCRSGIWGVVCCVCAWPCATVIGALAGAGLLGFVDASEGGRLSLSGGIEAAGLGLVAVIDALATSPVVVCVWLLGGLAVGRAGRTEARGPT